MRVCVRSTSIRAPVRSNVPFNVGLPGVRRVRVPVTPDVGDLWGAGSEDAGEEGVPTSVVGGLFSDGFT